MIEVLPTSLAQRPLGAKPWGSIWIVPLFCANCGHKGGYVNEDSVDFAFWLCNDCYAKHGVPAGLMVTPDEALNILKGE